MTKSRGWETDLLCERDDTVLATWMIRSHMCHIAATSNQGSRSYSFIRDAILICTLVLATWDICSRKVG